MFSECQRACEFCRILSTFYHKAVPIVSMVVPLKFGLTTSLFRILRGNPKNAQKENYNGDKRYYDVSLGPASRNLDFLNPQVHFCTLRQL